MAKIVEAEDTLNIARDMVELMFMAVGGLPAENQDQMRTGLMLVSERLYDAMKLLEAERLEGTEEHQLAA